MEYSEFNKWLEDMEEVTNYGMQSAVKVRMFTIGSDECSKLVEGSDRLVEEV